MKSLFNKEILIPEEKRYYIWVLLLLVGVMLFQFSLYPKLAKLSNNQRIHAGFQRQIKIYQDKQTQNMLDVSRQTKMLEDLSETSKIRGNPQIIFHKYFTIKHKQRLGIRDVLVGEVMVSDKRHVIPVQISFRGTQKRFFNLLRELNGFIIPIEIGGFEINRLSKTRVFVKMDIVISLSRR
jgi:hypothetical protein